MGRINNIVVVVVLVLQLVAYYNGGGGLNIVKATSIDDNLVLTYVYGLCNTQTYDNGSAFSQNLNTALSTLKQKAKESPYNLQKAGTVMAAYQCRGDLAPDSCSNCVSQAIQSALSGCPNAIGSRIQLDGCFLRYENYSFTVLDSDIVVELCNTQKDNSSAFQSQVTDLLGHVITSAPQDKLLYASASVALNSTNSTSSTLYALAQCLDYLSPAQCSDCLAAHSSSWKDCDSAVGSQIHSVSCFYRFETYPFYYAN